MTFRCTITLQNQARYNFKVVYAGWARIHWFASINILLWTNTALCMKNTLPKMKDQQSQNL